MKGPSSEKGTSDGTLHVVSRALRVLWFLAESDTSTVGVTQVADSLDISKAATHRVLTTLLEGGLVEVDGETRRYRLGPGVLALADKYRKDLDVLNIARSAMRALSAETEETVTISVLTGWERIYVDQVTPAREVQMSVQIGRPYPLHAGSSGKVTLAYMSADDVATYLSRPMMKVTELTVTDAQVIRQQLAEIRERGFAQSFGERQPGAGSTAAPILDGSGHLAAVMSVCGPIERFRQVVDACSERLVATTSALSSRLGYAPATTPSVSDHHRHGSARQ